MGVGSVPVACVALFFAGNWGMIGQIVLSVLIIYATRALGLWVLSKSPAQVPAESNFSSIFDLDFSVDWTRWNYSIKITGHNPKYTPGLSVPGGPPLG